MYRVRHNTLWDWVNIEFIISAHIRLQTCEAPKKELGSYLQHSCPGVNISYQLLHTIVLFFSPVTFDPTPTRTLTVAILNRPRPTVGYISPVQHLNLTRPSKWGPSWGFHRCRQSLLPELT
ncbi:hypothetical protein VTI28DRAFT_10539 [Corynascus sepedonium]